MNRLALLLFSVLTLICETTTSVKAQSSDKKMEAGRIKFIVVHNIGEAAIDKSVSWVEMKNALDCILDGEFHDK